MSVDIPGCVAFHPSDPVFSCGFSSGLVRVFDVFSAKVVAEHQYVSAYSLLLFIDSWQISLSEILYLWVQCVNNIIQLICRRHRGEVVGLVFTPDGEFMYSADSQGSLVLYNAFDGDYNVIRVVCMYARA